MVELIQTRYAIEIGSRVEMVQRSSWRNDQVGTHCSSLYAMVELTQMRCAIEIGTRIELVQWSSSNQAENSRVNFDDDENSGNTSGDYEKVRYETKSAVQ